MNTHNGSNHEPIQQFDDVVSTWQQWQSTTPSYFIPKTCVTTPLTISNSLQNQQPNPNIDLATINLEMEQIQFTKRLEQVHYINQKLLINQFPYHIWNLLSLV